MEPPPPPQGTPPKRPPPARLDTPRPAKHLRGARAPPPHPLHSPDTLKHKARRATATDLVDRCEVCRLPRQAGEPRQQTVGGRPVELAGAPASLAEATALGLVVCQSPACVELARAAIFALVAHRAEAVPIAVVRRGHGAAGAGAGAAESVRWLLWRNGVLCVFPVSAGRLASVAALSRGDAALSFVHRGYQPPHRHPLARLYRQAWDAAVAHGQLLDAAVAGV
jgi:hypothetical protein